MKVGKSDTAYTINGHLQFLHYESVSGNHAKIYIVSFVASVLVAVVREIDFKIIWIHTAASMCVSKVQG